MLWIATSNEALARITPVRPPIVNSAMNPNKDVLFTDVYPTGLMDLPFSTTLSDVDYVECTATFKYRKFDIKTSS